MNSRINAVQPMSQYGYGGKAVCQRTAMGMYVDAISQSADNQYIGTKFGKVVQELGAELLAVLGGVACTHHADHPQAVQVGIALEEQHCRRILALAQTRRIAFVAQRQATDTVLFGPLHLCFCPAEGFGTVERCHSRGMNDARKAFRQFFTETEYFGCAACGINQAFGTNMSDARTEGQGDATDSFVGIHSNKY